MTLFRSTGRLTLTALAVLMLYGCGSSNTVQEPQAPTEQSASVNITELLARAQVSQSPRREQLLLNAAKELSRRGDKAWARNLLDSIDPAALDASQYSEYVLEFSDIALRDGTYFLAQRILTNPRLIQQWQTLPTEQKVTLHQRRAELFMTLGEPSAAIEERLTMSPLIQMDPQASELNNEKLWQILMTMSEPELQYRLNQAQSDDNSELQGWYSLALINKHNPANLEEQLQEVHRWVTLWPDHPASLNLPQDLRYLEQLVNNQPERIALLLPQQGRLAKAGNAVRDGFMAAYYVAKASGARVPEIAFFDTSDGNIVEHYNKAMSDGAELVIGPLDKDLVTRLSQEVSLPVPTLAVNYAENTTSTTTNLFQFGLLAEDEAQQVAQRAWVEGHRYAMVISSDENWATRTAETFRAAWESLGGTIIDQSTFNSSGNYSDVIQKALQVDKSQTRARDIRSWAGGSLEFEPRRRQDADMLFMIARPSEARQIKPTLAFHYASDLPVYATHHLYDGTVDKKSDRDLDGIRFSTLPWFFEKNSTIKNKIQAYAKPTPSFERLYALGADSFQLYPRLTQLQKAPYLKLHGLTGMLTLVNNALIEREQVWAKMSAGQALALPRVVNLNSFDG